jgi:hypothetical protein
VFIPAFKKLRWGKTVPWYCYMYGNVSGAQGHVRGQNASGSSISTLMVCTQFAKKPCLCPLCFFTKPPAPLTSPRRTRRAEEHSVKSRAVGKVHYRREGPLPSGRSVVAKSHRRPHREEPSPTETLAMEPPLPLFCPSGSGS